MLQVQWHSEPAYYHDKGKGNMYSNSHIHNFVYDFYNAYLLWIVDQSSIILYKWYSNKQESLM